jgi:hypothetical protein
MFALLQTATGETAACTAFCVAVGTVLGPEITKLVLGAAALALVYWKSHQKIAAVSVKADQAEERAKVATAQATENKQQLEVLRSSLRPSAPAPGAGWSIEPGPMPPGASGSSGLYAPVRVEVVDSLPAPGRMPIDAARPPPRPPDEKEK